MEKRCDNCKHDKNIDSLNDRCQRCSAMSDIYNHYPMWEAKTAEKRTVMKTKIIASGNGNAFESCINNFIKDREVVDIKFMSVVDNHCIYDRALIIYEEGIE